MRALSLVVGRNRRRREKIFGYDYGCGLSTEQKHRIMAHAQAWSKANRRPGQHNGALTTKTLDVLHALVWNFHNAHTGRCFPSYETIADAVECAVSTVAKAVVALEEAGILTWANRLVRLTFRSIPKIIRTSNAYAFNLPPDDLGDLSPQRKMAKRPKSDKRCGTLSQDISYILERMELVDNHDLSGAREALEALAASRTSFIEREWLRKKSGVAGNRPT